MKKLTLNLIRHKPPELPTSLFGWIIPLIKIGDEEMLTNVGLDAVLVSQERYIVCTTLNS